MCGIAAIVSKQRMDGAYIRRMTDMIKHRGPNGEGHRSFYDGRVWLGHRRLSIIDLSQAGGQPMSYSNGQLWITYNGEIYNYIELRQELEELGYSFVSTTDTEVILAAYAHWGKSCLNYFNGMWSFVIVDLRDNTLFAARDRFGVKPLYYWIAPGGFVSFASEIKQFTVMPGWNPVMNGQRVYDYLNWGLADHTNETLFEGVCQLRGGEAVEVHIPWIDPVIGSGTLPIYSWYQLKPRAFSGDFMQAAGQFRELLSDSIRLRLRSDAPVGSLLSGGLDSSSIVCMIDEMMRKDEKNEMHHTFSACSQEAKYDERKYIEEVVRTKQVKAHYVYPSSDEIFDSLDEITWIQDEPFGSSSSYAEWNVHRLAGQHGFKVMLSGQGADEQLAGYHSFFSPYYTGLFSRKKWRTLAGEIRSAKKLHGYGVIHSVAGIANMLLPEAIRQKVKKLMNKYHVNPDWINMEKLGAKVIDPFANLGAKTNSIRHFSHLQIIASNLPLLLHWEDRESMAHSIESRLPFLDYRLVEFVLGLPDEYKLSQGVTKKVLRQGMQNVVPDSILKRMDKMGFVTPEEVWVREQKTDQFRQAFMEAVDLSYGILNANAVAKLERIIAGQEPFDFFVWRVISFGSWMKMFHVKASALAPQEVL